MKKTIVMIAMGLLATTAFSFAYANTNVVCSDHRVEGQSLVATFKLDSSNSNVELFVPPEMSAFSGTGTTSGASAKSGKTFSGECRRDEGAIELAITCNVITTPISGYKVRLYSIGGATLFASVTPWSRISKRPAVNLTCGESN
jgi:hypothetical protein